MENKDIKFSYETLWKFIIRPPRDEYTETMLGKQSFHYNSKRYIRKDFDIMSTQGYILKCSFIEPTKAYRPSVKMPVVIYLHGNSSSRIEGLSMAKYLLKKDINLFVFDFAGSGLSEGEYISLGYHESDDLGNVIDFLEKIPGVGKIGLWGRSMGAATAMIYAHRDKRIRAICLDSPFADFERLARELTKKNLSFSLPGFILGTMLSIVRGTILKKNGLDIDKLKPINEAEKTFQPVIFIHAINDELIDVKHSMDLFNLYGGQEKSLKCCEKGGHNSKRSSTIIKEIVDFFQKYLFNTHREKEKINKDKINQNNNLNMNYNFFPNNNDINNIKIHKIMQFDNHNNNDNNSNKNNEEDEIIINESQFSANSEIKSISTKFRDDKSDLTSANDEDEPFDEKNTERIEYAKKREKMDQQRLSDMKTLFMSIRPDIKNSFKNNNMNDKDANNNINNNNINNNINNDFNNNLNLNNNSNNKMNINFNQPKMNNNNINNNTNNNMFNNNINNNNFSGNFYNNFNIFNNNNMNINNMNNMNNINSMNNMNMKMNNFNNNMNNLNLNNNNINFNMDMNSMNNKNMNNQINSSNFNFNNLRNGFRINNNLDNNN